MRRSYAIVAGVALTLSMFAAVPARATHCEPGNISGCSNPLVVIVVEGIGNVCSKAAGLMTAADRTAYGDSCTYNFSDPTWVSKPVSPWNQSGGANGSKYQGLFWVGVGPAAVGPYALKIARGLNLPTNACVSNVGGAGCENESIGKLTAGGSTIGAHCGSSKGAGRTAFTSADRTLSTRGWLTWDQSAATVLPVYGETTHATDNGRNITYPAGRRPTVRGFTSSRGLGGSGNCGVTDPTTGFQVEGFVISY